MYRSSTGEFLLSLTPFKSFEDEKLFKVAADQKNFNNFYNYVKLNCYIDTNLGGPPICYSNYDNNVLKEFLYNSYSHMRGIYLNIDINLFKKIYDKYISIRELLQKYNNSEYFSSMFIGSCLYKVNLDNFKITEYKYIHTFGLLYDILNSYENCNYFIKVFDNNQIIYTFVDKLIINSFMSLTSNYILIDNKHDYYLTMNTILIILYYLFSYQLHDEFLFSKMTNNFEIVRDELKRRNRGNLLLLQLYSICVPSNISYYRKTKKYLNNDILLKYFVVEDETQVIMINNCRYVNHILRDIKLKDWAQNYYKNFIVYEKDMSYYVYEWIFLIALYTRYYSVQKETVSILSGTRKNNPYKFAFLNSLKNYEKSKYFYTKDDFNNKILNNGIIF